MAGIWNVGSKGMLQFITELVCVSAVWGPLLFLEWYGIATLQGFFCSDTSLQYPYRESTMTASIMYPVSCIFPFLGIIISICCEMKTNSFSLKSVYRQVLVFVFGFGLAHLLVDVGKFYGGRLRPHFFDVCRPDWSQIDCSVGYVTDYTCLGTHKTRLRKMRLSFPSAHASCICYGAVFFIASLLHTVPEPLPDKKKKS